MYLFQAVESAAPVISRPLDTVEQYIYSDITYMHDDDSNNTLVGFEEVPPFVEQDAEEHFASRDVLNKSAVLEVYT